MKITEILQILSDSTSHSDKVVSGVGTLDEAGDSDITFLSNSKYRPRLNDTNAAAVIISNRDVSDFKGIALVVDDPYLAYARVSQLFDKTPLGIEGFIHSSAVISQSAVIADSAFIGPNVVVGDNTIISEGCYIGANSVIGDECSLAKDVRINPNVTLYHDVAIGKKTVIHSGAVIGADGFGFAPNGEKWVKIAQIGGVRIGEHCDIGANTCIDRGAISSTVIGDHVILDNMVHIAHNVTVGDGTAMAGGVAIAGSTKIGKNCIFGGKSGVAGHLEVADKTFVAAMAMIINSTVENGSYSGGTGQMPTRDWRKSAARFRHLDSLFRRVSVLEKSFKGSNDECK